MDALPTAAVADACVRLGVPLRVAALRPVLPGRRVAGPVVPARHAGSVDVFFEAVRAAPAGFLLAVDNGGRLDEGCVGDLTALEARAHGGAGMLVWGAHRDTADLARMGFPVWSLGACPAGPVRVDARPPDALEAATVGRATARRGDWAYADDDGAVFVAGQGRAEVEALARQVVATERRQAGLAEAGIPLGRQLDFEGYLAARARDPALTFRAHLRQRGGAIEE
ncbi:MAG TPA: RraA family protein [Candidatus Thermoplasmatota archaeon]|nr:RraA family protein [Candidatus Thermoplasmatota archaeon]